MATDEAESKEKRGLYRQASCDNLIAKYFLILHHQIWQNVKNY